MPSKTLSQVRNQLKDLLPGDHSRITKARTSRDLLDITVEALEFRSNTLANTGFELGKKVHIELKRKQNAPKGRIKKSQHLNQELAAHFKRSLKGFKRHESVIQAPHPDLVAERLAWKSARDKYRNLTGKEIKEESLKKRLRAVLRSP